MSKNQIPFLFYGFPIRLEDHPLLNQDEKNILAKLIRRGARGWEFGERTFADNLEIGLYHFRRARQRLFTLGLIRIERRGVQQFIYFYEPNMKKWKITKDLQNILKGDRKKLNPDETFDFESVGFDSIDHFNNYFTKLFPNFKDGRKGRKKNKQAIDQSILVVEENSSPPAEDLPTPDDPVARQNEQTKKENERYKLKNNNIETAHPIKILSDYYYHYTDIEKLRIGDFNIDQPDKNIFLKTLDSKSQKVIGSIDSLDDETYKIIQELNIKIKSNSEPFLISAWLHKLWTEKRVLGQSSGGA